MKKEEFEHKENKSSTKSALKEYNTLIVILIILAFLVLGFVYSSIIYNSTSSERMNQMNRAADAISNFYSTIPGDIEELDTKNLNLYLDIAADTSGATIWVYRPSGRILYASDIPEEAIKSLVLRDKNLYLPKDITNLEIPSEGLNFTGGNLLGLFQDSSGNWLSVIRPIYNNDGELAAYLMLHYELEFIQEGIVYLIEGFLIVLLVAIVVALLIITIYNRRIAEPIEKLSEAANRVANGDYSARVDIAELKENSTVSSEDNDIIILARTFNRMIDQIERGNSEQVDFIASVSHDLRTPLTSIKGFVGAILDDVIPEDKQEHYLKIVQNEVDRLANLVSDMNTIIKLDTNDKESFDFTSFNINDPIARTIEGTEYLISQKNITVQTNIDNIRHNIYVYGDEQQIERVIYNLVTNAIKFVPEDDGVIYISVKAQGVDKIIVAVEDNGPGIKEEEIPHIFDRFYKSDRSRTGNSGSGLGLYICKRIIQKHEQHIFAGNSENMGGAKFEFTLDLSKKQ